MIPPGCTPPLQRLHFVVPGHSDLNVMLLGDNTIEIEVEGCEETGTTWITIEQAEVLAAWLMEQVKERKP